MKTIISKALLFILFLSLMVLTGCFGQAATTSKKLTSKTTTEEVTYPIVLKKLYNGKSVVTVNNNIARYISNIDNPSYLAEALYKRDLEHKAGNPIRYDYQCIKIEWEDTGKDEEFTVHIADNIEFNNEFTYTTRNTSVYDEIGFFIPGITYYYKVVGSISGESQIDSFISNAPIRYISADTVINVRDLGGWPTESGKIINYGKLYRGGALNEDPNASYLSDQSRRMFDFLGVRGEIDLRGGEDIVYLEENDPDIFLNKFDYDYPILREELVYFSYERMMETEQSRAKNNLPLIFKFLADENNYPIYFHCSVGADRTGTLAYIIEALLGVDFDHILIDYELTSFSTSTTGGIRNRSIIAEKDGSYYFQNPSIDDMSQIGRLWYCHNQFMQKYSEYSDNMSEVMEKYLLDVGVKQSDIDKFKEIMLG